MRSGRRGFLGALAGLPVLVGLGKKAALAEPQPGISPPTKPREMTTVVLEWADGTRENFSVPLPLPEEILRPVQSWNVGSVADVDEGFPSARPEMHVARFRPSRHSSMISSLDPWVTLPIYKEAPGHVLHSRGPGRGYACRECGKRGATGTDWDRVPCTRGSAWNVGYLDEKEGV